MSVFDQVATEQPTEGVEQAEAQATETQESFVSKLVQERGDKWSDPEVIAKGKLEADKHISELERQLAELREDLGKSEYAKEVVEALRNKAGGITPKDAAPKNNNVDAANQPNTTEKASDVDVESLVEQALLKKEKEAVVAQNLKAVDDALTTSLGTEAGKYVQERAAALGMSMDRLREIASESPSAFLTLVGQAPAKEKNADLSSSLNTSAGSFNTQAQKDFAYWQKMRRENPRKYYSPNTQNEMAQSRVQLGERFYNK